MGIRSRKLAAIGLYLLYCAAVVVLPIELFVRYYVIPGQNLGYLQIEADQFPFFRLKESFDSPAFTVRSGRREVLPRGSRPHAVAFVGDSVTFGTHVRDVDSYVEQVQRLQQVYDAYNFGVPGYGIPEIETVVSRLARENRYNAIVYTFNFNDVHAAMVGLLALLEDSDHRFASMDRYDGPVGWLKAFGKDHVKSLYALKYFGSNLSWRTLKAVFAGPEADSDPEPPRVKPQALCYDDILALSGQDTYQKPTRLWRAMYDDPQLIARLVGRLGALRQTVAAAGGRLFVAVNYDFLLFEKGTDAMYRRILDDVFHRSGVDIIDTYPLYHDHYRECGFFGDPRHPGPDGAHRLAALVNAALLERVFRPATAAAGVRPN
jgi:hypothetical protein